MIATITANGQGRCTWCRTEGEVLSVEFRDGLCAELCWRDFKTALKARSQNDGPPAAKPSSPDPKPV